jgi:hypothetical protein
MLVGTRLGSPGSSQRRLHHGDVGGDLALVVWTGVVTRVSALVGVFTTPRGGAKWIFNSTSPCASPVSDRTLALRPTDPDRDPLGLGAARWGGCRAGAGRPTDRRAW